MTPTSLALLALVPPAILLVIAGVIVFLQLWNNGRTH